MNKETAVNTLIGLFILSAVVVPFLAVGFALYGLSLVWKHFLPGVPGDVVELALLCFLSISMGISHLKKRLWSNALLSFSILAIPLSAWFRGVMRPDSTLWSLYPMFLLFLIPADRIPRRWKSALAAALAIAAVLLNAGLVGGAPARILAVCSFLVLGTWMTIQVRRHGQFAGLNFAPFSRTRA